MQTYQTKQPSCIDMSTITSQAWKLQKYTTSRANVKTCLTEKHFSDMLQLYEQSTKTLTLYVASSLYEGIFSTTSSTIFWASFPARLIKLWKLPPCCSRTRPPSVSTLFSSGFSDWKHENISRGRYNRHTFAWNSSIKERNSRCIHVYSRYSRWTDTVEQGLSLWTLVILNICSQQTVHSDRTL